MGEDSITGSSADLLPHFVKIDQLRVHDILALHTDYMRMRERFAAVIPVAPIRKSQFQDFIHFLEERYGLVDGCQAGCREFDLDLFVDLLRGGMILICSMRFSESVTAP
jgi:hypothetical protein